MDTEKKKKMQVNIVIVLFFFLPDIALLRLSDLVLKQS